MKIEAKVEKNLNEIEVSVKQEDMETVQESWSEGKIVVARTDVKEINDIYEVTYIVSTWDSSTDLGKDFRNISRSWRNIRENLENGMLAGVLKEEIKKRI